MTGRVLPALLVALALVAVACDATADEEGAGGPGRGEVDARPTIRMARANWDTGFMQAAIYRQLLEELGYEVTDPAEETRTATWFYPALARGGLDLWANGWFPLHEPFLERELVTGQEVREPIAPVGWQVRQGGLQGYLVDEATAEALDITSMDDLTREEVGGAFDHDGDGLADLLGCEAGWACRKTIDAHIEELDWGESVEQVVGSYPSHIEMAERRVARGEPVLLYTWTPNWTVEVLRPGRDVVWLESPALPDEEDEVTPVENLEGCAAEGPCHLGWIVNDIRAVANEDFLDANPPVRRLLEQIEIPLEDIVAQNARMVRADEYTEADVRRDAEAWIADHRPTIDRWLAAARVDE